MILALLERRYSAVWRDCPCATQDRSPRQETARLAARFAWVRKDR